MSARQTIAALSIALILDGALALLPGEVRPLVAYFLSGTACFLIAQGIVRFVAADDHR